jgi:phage terminase small subunit
MNLRQTRFAHAYAAMGNATKAAIAAGYSEKTACNIGEKLLRIAQIRAAIDALTVKVAKKFNLTAERVLQGLMDMAFSMDGAEHKDCDKIRALELLGKNLKLWDRAGETEKPPGDIRELMADLRAGGYRFGCELFNKPNPASPDAPGSTNSDPAVP